MSSAKKQKFYAYFVPPAGGKAGGAGQSKTGVTDRWAECEKMVSGKAGARFRAFESRTAAEAWLKGGAMYEPKAIRPRPKLERGIYFDAGTGRGEGVEISVTDENGKNLLHKALSRAELNRFGKHRVGAGGQGGGNEATNNYGELLALDHALTIARKERITRIFGDSKLVIEFWSKWRIKRKDLPEETVALADKVSRLREAFERDGGTVERISGDHNPADLGFHK
jgi:ribonuclease H-related protein